jgi:hypothetical protein
LLETWQGEERACKKGGSLSQTFTASYVLQAQKNRRWQSQEADFGITVHSKELRFRHAVIHSRPDGSGRVKCIGATLLGV